MPVPSSFAALLDSKEAAEHADAEFPSAPARATAALAAAPPAAPAKPAQAPAPKKAPVASPGQPVLDKGQPVPQQSQSAAAQAAVPVAGNQAQAAAQTPAAGADTGSAPAGEASQGPPEEVLKLGAARGFTPDELSGITTIEQLKDAIRLIDTANARSAMRQRTVQQPVPAEAPIPAQGQQPPPPPAQAKPAEPTSDSLVTLRNELKQQTSIVKNLEGKALQEDLLAFTQSQVRVTENLIKREEERLQQVSEMQQTYQRDQESARQQANARAVQTIWNSIDRLGASQLFGTPNGQRTQDQNSQAMGLGNVIESLLDTDQRMNGIRGEITPELVERAILVMHPRFYSNQAQTQHAAVIQTQAGQVMKQGTRANVDPETLPFVGKADGESAAADPVLKSFLDSRRLARV